MLATKRHVADPRPLPSTFPSPPFGLTGSLIKISYPRLSKLGVNPSNNYSLGLNAPAFTVGILAWPVTISSKGLFQCWF
jgi:hypothetical protein